MGETFVEHNIRQSWDPVEAAADRMEALRNLAFLMREDMQSQENLRMYLQLMDRVLDGMMDDERRRMSLPS